MYKLYTDRQKLRRGIQSFFDRKKYVEIDTPLIVKTPGTEVHLDYFQTEWLKNDLTKAKLYLRSSPELHMKRFVAETGMNAYQMGTCFRNGGEYSDLHHPEFTMLEWYVVEEELSGLMDETEALILHCAEIFEHPLKKAFLRTSVKDMIEEVTGISAPFHSTEFTEQCVTAGAKSVRESDDFETAFHKVMLEQVEPILVKKGPVFLYDFPSTASDLAVQNGIVSKRFELYLSGMELANAFQELTGQEPNEVRLTQSQLFRSKEKSDTPPMDKEFIAAMGSLPKCSGCALGFDRLLSYLIGAPSLNPCIPFRRDYDSF